MTRKLTQEEASELMRRRFAALNAKAQKQSGFIVNGKKVQNLQYAHKLVVKTAKAIAATLYDAMMQNNEANAVWKRFCEDLRRKDHEAEFVALATPFLLDDARSTLAGILGNPLKAHLHPEIYDALCKDNEIRGTGGLVPVAPQLTEAYRHGR